MYKRGFVLFLPVLNSVIAEEQSKSKSKSHSTTVHNEGLKLEMSRHFFIDYVKIFYCIVLIIRKLYGTISTIYMGNIRTNSQSFTRRLKSSDLLFPAGIEIHSAVHMTLLFQSDVCGYDLISACMVKFKRHTKIYMEHFPFDNKSGRTMKCHAAKTLGDLLRNSLQLKYWELMLNTTQI